MSERVTEEDCFNVYWNGEGEMPSHLCAADFARELSLARARVKKLEAELDLYTQRARELAEHDAQLINDCRKERDEARPVLEAAAEVVAAQDAAGLSVTQRQVRAFHALLVAARAAEKEER